MEEILQVVVIRNVGEVCVRLEVMVVDGTGQHQ